MSHPIYAIGDIHGQLGKLQEALARIEADGGPDARVVFLGDFVDRGPDSAGVVRLLRQGRADGRNWIILKGNHDIFFAEFFTAAPAPTDRGPAFFDWMNPNLGGVQTLLSYGIDTSDFDTARDLQSAARDVVPVEDIAFMQGLESYHLESGMLFVHAGIRPGVPLEEQSPYDLHWIREPFLSDPRPHPWLVVHGHTPQRAPHHAGNHVNLDTGAGFGRDLTAAVFQNGRVHVLEADGRRPLWPLNA